MVAVLAPRLVIEIGTAEGLSALTLKKYLQPGGQLVTFDLIPWREYPGSVVVPGDFADGRLKQRIGDLADPGVFQQHADLLTAADLLFVDAPKDGRFEPAFLKNLGGLSRSAPLVVLYDIRVWNMLSTCARDYQAQDRPDVVWALVWDWPHRMVYAVTGPVVTVIYLPRLQPLGHVGFRGRKDPLNERWL